MQPSEPTSTRPMNMDEYEKAKVERTLADVELLAGMIRNFLTMIAFCDEKGIEVRNRQLLDWIRRKDAPCGPGSDILKLQSIFEQAQVETIANINVSFREDLKKKCGK